MIEQIKTWDEELFLWLNSFHSDWMDMVTFQLSQTYTWLPFYAILIYFIYKAEPKNSWWVFGGVALTILISDQVTSGLMKPYFERLRPCHDERWDDIIHNYRRCGGLFGFASSHAANTFGLAVFLNLKMKGKLRFLPWLFLWAAVISYTRIYLGVHYPLDILAGALVGAVAALISWFLIIYLRKKILKILLK
ncbi:phosphatase PAP2 family protein [Algoriphagus sp. D3-2-R+10]|uniref:phosphatase PAP2 family protein n=1 Tax=Algoriphagus aurantiacus TaxID=3103948 RepID=UPI002B38688C|nr:phosphatase PAP2 family protein [Algoriphagus sp. D3-2-R+10]MEB2775177.1 phosphatase PAP2 family protein [Algoriphagus sp. D3-2-R+10]